VFVAGAAIPGSTLWTNDAINLCFRLTTNRLGRRNSRLTVAAKATSRSLMKPAKALTGVGFQPAFALAFNKPLEAISEK
jgi:hypothetical protein